MGVGVLRLSEIHAGFNPCRCQAHDDQDSIFCGVGDAMVMMKRSDIAVNG